MSALRRASDHELLRHRGGLAGPDLLAERRDAFELLLALVGMWGMPNSEFCSTPCLRRTPGGIDQRLRRAVGPKVTACSAARSSRRVISRSLVVTVSMSGLPLQADSHLVRNIQLERSHRCAPRRRTARRVAAARDEVRRQTSKVESPVTSRSRKAKALKRRGHRCGLIPGSARQAVRIKPDNLHNNNHRYSSDDSAPPTHHPPNKKRRRAPKQPLAAKINHSLHASFRPLH